MIKIDEHDLIEFFEELPLSQTNEEKVFFGTIVFEIIKEGIVFTFSISEHFRDVHGLRLTVDGKMDSCLRRKIYKVLTKIHLWVFRK
jgi:hypothetical protein